MTRYTIKAALFVLAIAVNGIFAQDQRPPMVQDIQVRSGSYSASPTPTPFVQKTGSSNAAAATDKKLGGQTLTAEEQLNIDGNADMAVYIKDMRAAAQANLTDPNFATATYWPAPGATLLAAKAQN